MKTHTKAALLGLLLAALSYAAAIAASTTPDTCSTYGGQAVCRTAGMALFWVFWAMALGIAACTALMGAAIDYTSTQKDI